MFISINVLVKITIRKNLLQNAITTFASVFTGEVC